ncbi:DgyrCDS3744 [Dimorphilus gyrociliatus]|uniref:Gamma-tubulin complex component n=1 Tax=Dimorphilus gyrociliatus TaxID=2664684 RepID=A0A7I8VG79_9ANNE|nr:DgyrCDS3744 [Dimorphilus gyrociliatus]
MSKSQIQYLSGCSLKLISAFTDFGREDENYEICHDFILSNLRFHRYLDTNSHDMKRKAQGLIDKFLIHAQHPKAGKMAKCLKSLESLTDFSALRFIMLLANRPTEYEYVEDFERVEEEPIDDFDWTEYLNRGLEVYNIDSTFSSEDELEEDDKRDDNEAENQTQNTTTNNNTLEGTTDTEEEDKTLVSLVEEIEYHDGLEKRVVDKYWRSGGKFENIKSSMPSANLYNNWFAYSTGLSKHKASTSFLNDYILIRESIWLFCGSPAKHIFDFINYTPRVNSLSEHSLIGLLKVIVEHAKKLKEMFDYTDSLSQKVFCQTEEAFISYFASLLNEIRKKFLDIEKTLIVWLKENEEPKCPLTLLKFVNMIEPEMKSITLYYEIFYSLKQNMDIDFQLRSLFILSELYNTVTSRNLIGSSSINIQIYKLFLNTLRPYLDIIYYWIWYGELRDCKNEFLIQRSKIDKTEELWHSSYTLNRKKFLFFQPILKQLLQAAKSVDVLQQMNKLQVSYEDDNLFDIFSENMLQIDIDGWTNMDKILKNGLYSHVIKQCDFVCKCLLDVLLTDYQLTNTFKTLQQFYLLEDGETMRNFYLPIFEMIRDNQDWKDVTLLTTSFQDSINNHELQSFSSRFHVTVEESDEGSFDMMKLNFDVRWPENIVVHSASLTLYNRIFAFLLQIKRMKYALDNLRFSNMNYNLTQEAKHRMCILRMKFLHFINNLHVYIMRRILQTSGLQFSEHLRLAKNVEDLISAHNRYIKQIYSRCLLSDKLSFIRQAIFKIFNAVSSLEKMWTEIVNINEITALEVQLSKTVSFLASFLMKVIRKGFYPHLEFLAFSLQPTKSARHNQSH